MSESGLPLGATSYGNGEDVSPPRTPDTPVDVTDLTPTLPLGIPDGNIFAAGGGLTPRYEAPPPVVAPAPSGYGEIFDAMLKSTPTAYAFHLMSQPAYPPDPTYNPVDDPQIKGTPYEQMLESNFMNSQSAPESAQIIRDISAEQGRASVLSYGRGGITGVMAGMASGLLDPSILIPVGGWVKGGIAIGRAGRLFRAVDTAIGVGLGTAAQEAELQTLMQTRTAEESGIAIGGSVLLGAVLGGVFGKVHPQVAEDLSRQIEAHMNAPELDPVLKSALNKAEQDMTPQELTAFKAHSAAGAQIADLERGTAQQRGLLGDFKIPESVPVIGGREIGIGRALQNITPKGRLQYSELRTSRMYGADLMAGNALEENYTKGIVTSRGGSVEARANASYGDYIGVIENNRAEFAKYRFGKQVPMAPTAAALQKFAGQAKGQLTYPEFRQEITNAWLAGDEHAIPEVQAAAKFAREKGFNPPRDEAIALKMDGYTEDMKPQSGDKGYVHRMYQREAIVRQGDDFNKVIFDGFKRAQAAAKQKHDDWIASHTADIEQQIKDLELSGPQRNFAMAEIGGKLKALREGPGKTFAPVDEQLSQLRAAQRAAREAGPTTQAAADTSAAVKAVQEKAGSAYADFVSTRNALMSRMSRISNNIVGRENQAARLRAKIADVENANVDRLYRMHNRITDLEDRIRREGPEGKQAELDQLRTDFGKVLERSQAAQDKAAAATAKAKEQLAEHPAPFAPAAPPPVRVPGAGARGFAKFHGNADIPEAPGSSQIRLDVSDESVHGGRDFKIFAGDKELAYGLMTVQGKEIKIYDIYASGVPETEAANTLGLSVIRQALAAIKKKFPDAEVIAGDHSTGARDVSGTFTQARGNLKPVLIKAGPNPELSMPKRPVLDMLKARGGVDPESTLGAELRHLGVNNKTAPGLFRGGLEGGLSSADNIVASEVDLFSHSYAPGEYIPEADILAAVRDEMHGEPRRTPEQLQAIDEYAARVEHNAGAKEDMASLKAAATLKRIETAEAKKLAEMTDLAARIGERENFDAEGATADLRVLIERRLAQSAQVVEDASRYMTDLSEQLKAKNPDLVKAKVAALKQRLSAVANRRGSQLLEMSDQEIMDAATGIRNNLTGLGPRMALPSDLIVQGPRGPLKERALNFVTTQELKPFLQWDSEEIMKRYNRTMNVDINLIRKFGSVDLKDQVAKIVAEGNALKVGKSVKEQARINDVIKHDVRDLTAMRDILRGTYMLPKDPDGLLHRTAMVAKTWNLLASLGMMTVSSLSDLGKAVFVNGMTRSMRTVFTPMFHGVSGFNLARRDIKAAGVGTDMVSADQVLAFSDIAKEYSAGTMFERGLSKAGHAFGTLTLMNPWNASLKQFVGVTTITRALEDIDAMVAGKIGAKERGWLLEGGIDESLAAKISEQVAQHGGATDGGGLRWANTGGWDVSQPGVAEARRALHAFINRDVNRTIVTPGIGDKPLKMHGDIGGLVGQFQSFAFASIQHTLVSGLQQKDMAVLNSMLHMLFWGAVSYKIKSDLAGFATPDPTTGDGAKVWAAEALDNSGILGVLMNADHAVEKATGDKFGLSALTGRPARRYSNVNLMGAFLGPSFGRAADMADIFAALSTGNVSQSTVHKGVKMVPLQNLAWARWMFQKAEGGINNYFGIPQRRQ